MNLYVTVEGVVGEAKVYQHWIPLVNPRLRYVQHISQISSDHFSIIAGGGYPRYFDVIKAAIEDINEAKTIDRLVIAVDSELMTYEEKYSEIERYISKRECSAEIRIVVQHFCLETWALGNKVIIRPNPQCEILRNYLRFYNVRLNDPELLPAFPSVEQLNRARFAEKYLKRALNDKYRHLTYSKGNPDALLHFRYFERVRDRFQQTRHIPSFENFLQAFI